MNLKPVRCGALALLTAAAAVVLSLPLGAAASSEVANSKTCAYRAACSHHGTTYRVKSVRLTRSIGSGFSRETTSGRFVLITVTMTNTNKNTSTILASNLKLRTRGGDTYEISDNALYLDHALAITQELQPKLPVRVILLYELPTAALKGSQLEVNDFWSGDKMYMKLGL
jgi:hypothetical protein